MLFYILETAENLYISTFSRDLTIGLFIPGFFQCPYGEGQPWGWEMKGDIVWQLNMDYKLSMFETWLCHLLVCDIM